MNAFEAMAAVIAQRRAEPMEGSYTCYLFEKGLDKILKRSARSARRRLSRRKMAIRPSWSVKLTTFSII